MTRRGWLVFACLGGLSTAGGAFANNALRPSVTDVEKYCDVEAQGAHKLSEDLRHRERELEKREYAVAAAEAELKASEATLAERLKVLQATRDEIAALLGRADVARDEKIAALVKMIESGRASNVAPLFGELEPALAVDVLDRMNRTKAGRLLVALPPSQAAELAQRMTAPLALPAETP